MRTVSEITKVVDERWNELRILRDRWEADYGLWRLTEYQLGSDNEYDNYTSNKPRSLAGKIVNSLARARLLINFPTQGDESERAAISMAEKFVYGCLNLADYRTKMTPGKAKIQAQLSFFVPIRGWDVIRCIINKDDKRNTYPDISIWDPFDTIWEQGKNGLEWVCHKRKATRSQIKSEYDHDIGENNKEAYVYDFWDEEINAIIVDKDFVKKPEPHKFDHIPIYVGHAGPNPLISSETYTDLLSDVGESIFATDRKLYEQKNKAMTLYMTIMGQAAHNPLAVSSSGGKKTLQQSPYYKGSVVYLDSDKGETVTSLVKPEAPHEAAAMLSMVTDELTEGGLPYFGQAPFPASGYLANILSESAQSIMFPYQQEIEFAFGWIARELLTQYTKGFNPMRLWGRTNTNEYFDMTLSPKDVKGDWYPDIKLLPKLPEDEAQKYVMAQQAVQFQLMSKRSIREKLLGIQDPDAEQAIIDLEQGNDMMPIKLRKIAVELVNDGRPDLAQIFLAEIQRQETSMMMPQPNQRQQKSDVKEPQYATGVPRNVMPSEEMGKVQ